MISIIIRRLTPESQIRILQVVIDNDYVEVALLLAIPDMIIIIISIITRWIVGKATVCNHILKFSMFLFFLPPLVGPMEFFCE